MPFSSLPFSFFPTDPNLSTLWPVSITCGVVLKRLKVLCSVPSRSGPGSSSGNGNSLHGTVVDVPSAAVDVFVVGVVFLFAGVTGSPLGVT